MSMSATYGQVLRKTEESIRIPGAGVTDICEASYADIRKGPKVLQKQQAPLSAEPHFRPKFRGFSENIHLFPGCCLSFQAPVQLRHVLLDAPGPPLLLVS